MRNKVLLIVMAVLTLLLTTSCAAKAFEKEINVVFVYEDELIGSETITQFKNAKTPTLDDAYIPDGYKFFGWTPIDLNKVKATNENFQDEYIGAGKMVHYADVIDYVKNETVVCRALMIDKAEIPTVYHYNVIAWYNKPATSGIDEALMSKFETALLAYLRTAGVSEEDLATIVIRGYTGNVGTSCGQIMQDEDVDIMLGWGSKDNVTSTGGMKAEMLLETASFPVGSKSRTIHKLTDKESTNLIFTWLQSDECKKIFE